MGRVRVDYRGVSDSKRLPGKQTGKDAWIASSQVDGSDESQITQMLKQVLTFLPITSIGIAPQGAHSEVREEVLTLEEPTGNEGDLHSLAADATRLAAAFDVDEQIAPAVDKDILSCIRFLGQSAKIMQRSKKAVGLGGYSEVFRGRCLVEGRGQVDVAIKRLRFHIDDEAFTKVCARNRVYRISLMILVDIREGDICVVEAEAPEYSGTTGVHLLRRHWVSIAHI